jgi:hypothetical protein
MVFSIDEGGYWGFCPPQRNMVICIRSGKQPISPPSYICRMETTNPPHESKTGG